MPGVKVTGDFSSIVDALEANSPNSITPITPSFPTPITATTTSSTVLAANAGRRYAILINDGSVDVYLKVGEPAVAHTGIRINANGGSYEMSRPLGNLMTGAVTGITVSGSAVVLVTEG